MAGTSDYFGDLAFEAGAQVRAVQVAVDATELLAGLDHLRRRASASPCSVAPALHVRGPLPSDSDHGLDRWSSAACASMGGTPSRSTVRVSARPSRRLAATRRWVLSSSRAKAWNCASASSALSARKRAHLLANRPTQVLRELVGNVPDLVRLAPNDDRMVQDVHDRPCAGRCCRRAQPGSARSRPSRGRAARQADPLPG